MVRLFLTAGAEVMDSGDWNEHFAFFSPLPSGRLNANTCAADSPRRKRWTNGWLRRRKPRCSGRKWRRCKRFTGLPGGGSGTTGGKSVERKRPKARTSPARSAGKRRCPVGLPGHAQRQGVGGGRGIRGNGPGRGEDGRSAEEKAEPAGSGEPAVAPHREECPRHRGNSGAGQPPTTGRFRRGRRARRKRCAGKDL
ncbi:hypothetical protein P4S83_08945 [Aneurinibacillus thermoaerophilus]|uniref:hypothetical protein n=2 Tax=Aneurinibacillus thermoaerophilus TaxID=143495 RepID=UPI0030C94E1D